MFLLTSNDVYCYICHVAHAGVTRVLARVRDTRRHHHQGGHRHVALLRDQAHSIPPRTVRHGLQEKWLSRFYILFSKNG